MSSLSQLSYNTPQWWKEAVIYQIYPASFKDSNGDGWGDLGGMISKLDYLKELGIDIIWTSPIYKSPKADMGYDISDYKDIDPTYGSLADVDELIAQLKKRDMKLMMDLVVNHTSNEHDWFLESKSNKTNPKRDWYHWRPAKYDKDGNRQPPNNWGMLLGEINSAWTWDEGSQEYYLSLFTPEQPDLNWENPDVRAAVHDAMRFWLDRGVAGFRMDVINLISKVEGYPDGEVVNPDHPYQPGDKYFANGPRLHEFLQEMNKEALSHYDTITVGEMPFVNDENEVLRVVSPERKELNMIFIFDIVRVEDVEGDFRMAKRSYKKSEIRKIMAHWQEVMMRRNGWNSLFIENHDVPRSVSRYVDDSDEMRFIGAKLLSLMMTTLSGTLFVYQGQEIGHRNVPESWDISEYKDVESINYWKKVNAQNEGKSDKEEKLKTSKGLLRSKARDNARTPVQWTSEKPNGGFCPSDAQPWMRVNDDFAAVNAEDQVAQKDGMSVWQFWQRGLANRKEHKDVFVYGGFELFGDDNEDDPIFAFRRSTGEKAFDVVLNFSPDVRQFKIPEHAKITKWCAGTYSAGDVDKPTSGTIELQPWEGLLGME